jgi:hypothetical protein
MSYFGIPIRNGLPIGLGTVAPLGINTFPPFSPASLFANGEQGWWYDPSNFATLFQDSAGTTPVTAVEQPVGLQLDLSQGGRQALPTSTSWTINSGDGVVTVVGDTVTITGATTITRVDMVAPGWAIGNHADISITSSIAGATSPLIFLGGGNPYTPTAGARLYQNVIASSTTMRLQVASGTASFVLTSRGKVAGNHRFQSTSANRPVVSARVNLFVGTATLATQSVTTRAAAHTLTFTGAGSITLSGTATGTFNAGTHSVTTTAGSLTATVSGTVTQADLRETNVGVGLPAYQAVVTSTNYDSTGFPVYIKPNGSNQFMQTNSINFTATDKVTVWQGVRKLSDAAQSVVAELSASIAANNGTFLLTAPNSAAANYNFASKGTTLVDNIVTTYTSPITNVLVGIGDISGPVNSVKVNGGAATTDTSSQGTGNYGTYPAYFYARAGTSLFFNGNDYGSIARGAASTAAQITNGETYINSKTKAY